MNIRTEDGIVCVNECLGNTISAFMHIPEKVSIYSSFQNFQRIQSYVYMYKLQVIFFFYIFSNILLSNVEY